MNRAESQTSFFTQDCYNTPPGREQLLHKLLLRSRIYYIIRFLGVVFGYWPAARRGDFDMETWHKAAFHIFKILEESGGRFSIRGLSSFRKTEGPVVFVSNHMSTTETLILPAMIYPYKNPVFVIKEQLLHIPFFGAFLQECIAVTRKSPSEDFKQVMTMGAEMISKGYSIIIFPQATRNVTFDPSTFNTLGIKLARRSNVPVIPLALKTDFWKEGKIVKDLGPLDQKKILHFEFGEPMNIEGNGKKEHEQIVSFIKSRVEAWGRE